MTIPTTINLKYINRADISVKFNKNIYHVLADSFEVKENGLFCGPLDLSTRFCNHLYLFEFDVCQNMMYLQIEEGEMSCNCLVKFLQRIFYKGRTEPNQFIITYN